MLPFHEVKKVPEADTIIQVETSQTLGPHMDGFRPQSMHDCAAESCFSSLKILLVSN